MTFLHYGKCTVKKDITVPFQWQRYLLKIIYTQLHEASHNHNS